MAARVLELEYANQTRYRGYRVVRVLPWGNLTSRHGDYARGFPNEALEDVDNSFSRSGHRYSLLRRSPHEICQHFQNLP